MVVVTRLNFCSLGSWSCIPSLEGTQLGSNSGTWLPAKLTQLHGVACWASSSTSPSLAQGTRGQGGGAWSPLSQEPCPC